MDGAGSSDRQTSGMIFPRKTTRVRPAEETTDQTFFVAIEIRGTWPAERTGRRCGSCSPIRYRTS
jgi:hypothetical protein